MDIEINSYSPTQIQAFAERLGVKDAAPFGSGVVGNHGDMVVYLADRRLVPGFDRMNWDLTRLFSERFSCLVMSKEERGQSFRYQCRSGSTVLVKRSQSDKFTYFVAKLQGSP